MNRSFSSLRSVDFKCRTQTLLPPSLPLPPSPSSAFLTTCSNTTTTAMPPTQRPYRSNCLGRSLPPSPQAAAGGGHVRACVTRSPLSKPPPRLTPSSVPVFLRRGMMIGERNPAAHSHVRSGQSAVLARKEGGKEGCMHSAHCAGSQLDDGEKSTQPQLCRCTRFALSVHLICFL